MDKWIAGFLQVGAATLFVFAGTLEAVPLLFPAAAAQLAGLALWGRHRASGPELPKPAEPALDARLARIEEVLGSVQTDTEQLREGRDFMEELYAQKAEQSRALPGRVD